MLVSNRTGLIRRFIHLDEFLKQCNAWKPPGKSGYKRARCRYAWGWDWGQEPIACCRGGARVGKPALLATASTAQW